MGKVLGPPVQVDACGSWAGWYSLVQHILSVECGKIKLTVIGFGRPNPPSLGKTHPPAVWQCSLADDPLFGGTAGIDSRC